MKKLGKKEAVHDPKALRFGDYLKAAVLPTIPAAFHWGAGVPRWLMYGNDTLGDCTIAAAAHHEGIWTFKEGGKEIILPESEIVTAYSAVSGYVPGNENTDNGAAMADVLTYWTQTGIGGSKLLGSAALEPGNHLHIQASIYLFGGCYIGLQMPVTAQAQSVKPNGIWSVVPGYKTNANAQPGSWGGHCVALCGYNAQSLCVISWGTVYYMTWPFLDLYVDEAYSPLSPQWCASVAPNQFDLAQLQADLKMVT